MNKLGRIHWKERLEPRENVRRELPRMITDYFVAVRELLQNDPPPAELHQARLASKSVRYALELFRPCYGPGLDTRLEALRQLQQILGEVNDAAMVQRLLAGASLPRQRKRAAVAFAAARAEARAREFRRQWTEVFDAPGQLQWWVGYLSRAGKNPTG